MSRPPIRPALQLVIVLAMLWLESSAVAEEAPTLAVVIAIDQLRNDRVTAALSGGLGRLAQSGRRFVNSDLDHGLTNTCPGHAALITGMQPARAGIPGNSYVDRDNWRTRYCVEDDDRSRRVLGGTEGRSPHLLKVDALGDWLKAGDPARRVYSIGGKDRSAIIMGGRAPEVAYWFDADQAVFTTSGYYAREFPDYLKAFNSALANRLIWMRSHWISRRSWSSESNSAQRAVWICWRFLCLRPTPSVTSMDRSVRKLRMPCNAWTSASESFSIFSTATSVVVAMW